MNIVFASFFLLLASPLAAEFKVPRLQGFVNDRAQVVSSGFEKSLSQRLLTVKERFGIELVVLTLPNLEGLTIEQASIKVVDQWKLGTQKDDKGLLILLALQERKVRIEVGQGLEGDLTDLKSKRIIDEVMLPLLREGDFENALLMGAYQSLQTVLPQEDIKAVFSTSFQSKTKKKSGRNADLFILILFVIVFLISRMGGGGGHRAWGRRHYGLGGGGWGSGGGFGGGGLGGGGGFSGGGASGGW